MCHNLSILSTVRGYLRSFQDLAIINNDAMNILAQVSVGVCRVYPQECNCWGIGVGMYLASVTTTLPARWRFTCDFLLWFFTLINWELEQNNCSPPPPEAAYSWRAGIPRHCQKYLNSWRWSENTLLPQWGENGNLGGAIPCCWQYRSPGQKSHSTWNSCFWWGESFIKSIAITKKPLQKKRLDQSASAFHTHTTANVPGGPLE